MPTPQKIRRQRPGIRAEQTTITLPGKVMERLREEADAQGITISLYVRNLIVARFNLEEEVAA